MSGPDTPLVSIVVCSYNQAEYVIEAVESALNQTYRNIEVIVVENGSTDASPSLLRRYLGDERVKLLIFDKNEAPTRRLNLAIGQSRGEFISLLYADDFYLPEKIERQLDCFAGLADDYGVVYSPGYRLNVYTGERWLDLSLDESGEILGHLLLGRGKGFINPISPMMRRACFERYRFQEDLFIEGESINFRFAMTFKYRYLGEPLVVMREHDGNIGKAIKGNIGRLMTMLDRLKVSEDFPPRYLGAVEVFRSRILRDSGWQGVRVVGDPEWSRQCLLRAVRTCPRQALHPRTVAGLLLSFLPAPARGSLNRAGNAIRGHQGIPAFVDLDPR